MSTGWREGDLVPTFPERSLSVHGKLWRMHWKRSEDLERCVP